MADDVAGALDGRFRGRVETAFPLDRLTTYRLGGPARLYVEPASADDLDVLARALRAHEPRLPVLVLGRGSNLVVSDAGYDGVVVRLGDGFAWIEQRGGHGMEAGGSTSLPLLANWAARRALGGLEFAVAIPGSVGGAVRMNAGAHGRDVSGCLRAATIFDVGRLAVEERDADTLGLSYRRSALTADDVVLSARFELAPSTETEVRAKMESYRRHRSETQPGAVQNAGSVFKNPPGDAAGRLVEATGLKGFRVGGAAVSDLHANFFVAEPGATAQDVFDLVRAVKERVRQRWGVELDEEIRFVGHFRSEDGADELG